MDKAAFQRACPDCGKTYTVDASYTDEAYEGHANDEKNCVCTACFLAFSGMTIDELIGSPYSPNDGEVK